MTASPAALWERYRAIVGEYHPFAPDREAQALSRLVSEQVSKAVEEQRYAAMLHLEGANRHAQQVADALGESHPMWALAAGVATNVKNGCDVLRSRDAAGEKEE